MTTKSQYDIENRFGSGGSEGTSYTVALSTIGDFRFCTVTDDADDDAVVVVGKGMIATGEETAALYNERASLAARRALGLDDSILPCLTTTQKDTLTNVRDGTHLIDVTLNQQETLQSGSWVSAASAVETAAFTGTTLTLLDSHSGKHLTFDNASAITVTLDTGLKAGFECTLEQIGAGQVQVSANGTTINSLSSYTKTSGQYAVAKLIQTATNVFTFSGDTAS